MNKNSIRKKYSGISRKEFLLRFFDLWNVLQVPKYRLTDKEAWILAEILLLPERYKYSRLSSPARKLVLDSVNSQGWDLSYQGLTQLVRTLTYKKVLTLDQDGQKQVIPAFEPLIDKNRVEFDLTISFQIDNNK